MNFVWNDSHTIHLATNAKSKEDGTRINKLQYTHF